jgi:hypothetical protein
MHNRQHWVEKKGRNVKSLRQIWHGFLVYVLMSTEAKCK